jgi:DNA-binding NtrC family response regulator
MSEPRVLDTTTLSDAFNGRHEVESHLVANVPTLEELERVHIRYVLERVRWHQGRAAAVLGISSKTLYRKIRQYGFKRPHGIPNER